MYNGRSPFCAANEEPDQSQDVPTVPADSGWPDLIELAWKYSLLAMDGWKTQIGRYKFQFSSHSTGKHLKIYAVLDSEELLVWTRDKWINSGYGSFKDIQGWVHAGPWESEIQDHMAEIAVRVARHEATQREHEARKKQQEVDDYEAKVDRFREAFAE